MGCCMDGHFLLVISTLALLLEEEDVLHGCISVS